MAAWNVHCGLERLRSRLHWNSAATGSLTPDNNYSFAFLPTIVDFLCLRRIRKGLIVKVKLLAIFWRRQNSYVLRLFGSSANIQQWASHFTAGVSWLSRPDQLTRLQTTSSWDGFQQAECSNREVCVERMNICRHQFVQRWEWNLCDQRGVFVS